MQPIRVNLCVKESRDYINYKLSSFTVNENFQIQLYVEEVENLSNKQRKQFKKTHKAFISTTISFLSLSSRSMAQSLTQNPNIPTTGLPPDLMQPIMELLQLSIKASLILAAILLVSAGVLRMFGKSEKAIAWVKDIIKGLVQILIATPIVFLIYYVVTLLFGDFTAFKSPF